MRYALDMHRVSPAIEQLLRLLAIIAAVYGRRMVGNGLHNHMTIIRQRAFNTNARGRIMKAKRLQIDAIQCRILGYGAHIERGKAQILQLITIAGAELTQRMQGLLHALLHVGGAA